MRILTSSSLPWRRGLARHATGRLGRHLRVVVLLLAAEPLGRRAQPAADALGLRLRALGAVGLGLRARIELAADELDLRDLGVQSNQAAAVQSRIERLRDEHARKPSFVQRLQRAGLIAD